LITASGSVAIAIALGTALAAYGRGRWGFLAALAGVGFVATLIALSGRVAATWWAVAAFGAEYSVFILGRSSIDVWAPIVGTGLLVLAELVLWSVRARAFVRSEAGVSARQLVDLGAACLGSLAVGWLVVAVADVSRPRGLELTIMGVVAASATLVLVLALARRLPPRPVSG
jgi:hypothetical protein